MMYALRLLTIMNVFNNKMRYILFVYTIKFIEYKVNKGIKW